MSRVPLARACGIVTAARARGCGHGFVFGGAVHLFQPWTIVDKIETDHRWSIAQLQQAADKWGEVTFDQTIPM
jgi:hypothetical protein